MIPGTTTVKNKAMNGVALVAVLVALCLCGATEDLDARVINLRESLALAPGDTISAQTVMDSIKVATREDTLVCDSLVVGETLYLKGAGIDTVRCTLHFGGTTFQAEADFRGVTFQKWIDLLEGTFQRHAYFRGATFQEQANFLEVTFEGQAYFMGAAFEQEAIFRDAKFEGQAIFRDAKFEGEANFWGTRFKGEANFRGAKFGEAGYFGGAKFEGVANFWGTRFERETNFWGVEFREAIFWDARFEGEAIFWGAKLEGEASFRDAKFEEWVSFGMITAPKGIYITWPQLDGHVYYDPPNYFSVLRNFQQLGYTDDYDECYYDFRVQARKHEQRWYSPIRWAEWIFLDLTCGYGVKPFRAGGWVVGLMLFFTLIYTKKGAIEFQSEKSECNGMTEKGQHCRRKGRKPGTEFCHLHQDQATRSRRFWNALYVSVGTFTTLGYGAYRPVGKYRYCAMLEGLIGWLLLALFLVTLGKKWIR